MLQSVGMTGWQVKQILIYEGLGYSILPLGLILPGYSKSNGGSTMGGINSFYMAFLPCFRYFSRIIPLLLITALFLFAITNGTNCRAVTYCRIKIRRYETVIQKGAVFKCQQNLGNE